MKDTDRSKQLQNSRMAYPFNFITKPVGPLCNLNCSYCFYLSRDELFHHEKKKDYTMSSEILELYTKQYILGQPEGTKEVVFAWQGGEPTLLSKDFYEMALAFQKKYNPGTMVIRNSLQTNGTLITDELARFYKENDFLIGISIDGPEKLHNRYRMDRTGDGSFSRVMKGIEILKKFNVEFNTLSVVQDDNSLYPEEVYNFLKEAGSGYIQFIPIVEPEMRNGSVIPSEKSVPSLRWGEFLTRVFQSWLKNDIGKVFVQHFDLTLAQYMGVPSSLCVHSRYCGKALAIEHNGDIYSCDHFVNPDHRLGHISQPLPETAGGEKQVKFGMDKFDTLTRECLECPYLGLCYGGCPKDRLVNTKTGRQNVLCEGYAYYYRQTHPVFMAMAAALKNREHASGYRRYLRIPEDYLKGLNRNAPCPCLSGKKFKNCHGA